MTLLVVLLPFIALAALNGAFCLFVWACTLLTRSTKE